MPGEIRLQTDLVLQKASFSEDSSLLAIGVATDDYYIEVQKVFLVLVVHDKSDDYRI